MSWTLLHAHIHRTLRQRQLLPHNERVLVAVSGGQDSLCLAQLLLDLQPKWGWELAIAHCDHRWRSDSRANAEHVGQLARSWQLPFYLQTATESIQSEASARQWRYQALSEMALKYSYKSIVTGHTASDRAETLLYNLMRGSGADGLQALTWKRPLIGGGEGGSGRRGEGERGSGVVGAVPPCPPRNEGADLYLVRPLLEIARSQTGAFCQEIGLRVWEDSTNADVKYSRNRIRRELIPYLQANFNPQVEQHLAQTAELLRADVEYLEESARQLLQQSISQDSAEVNSFRRNIRVNRRILRAAPLAIQRRAVRQLLQQVLKSAPSFEQVEKLTALLSAPNRSQSDPFPGGAIARVEGDWICIQM